MLTHIKAESLSVTGAAFVAEVSKMTVSRWCAQAGIDPGAAEHRRWLDLRQRAQRMAAGLGVRDDIELEHHPGTGPSKATLRKQAEQATREWAGHQVNCGLGLADGRDRSSDSAAARQDPA